MTMNNTKSNGRRMAREIIKDGDMSPHDMEMVALRMRTANMGQHGRPHLVAGFLEVAHQYVRNGVCWNGFCVQNKHDDARHVDATGESWEQQRGTSYCAECGSYTACDHGSPVVTVYER